MDGLRHSSHWPSFISENILSSFLLVSALYSAQTWHLLSAQYICFEWMDGRFLLGECYVESCNVAEGVWNISSSPPQNHMAAVLRGAGSGSLPHSMGRKNGGMQKAKILGDFSKWPQCFLYTLRWPQSGSMVWVVETDRPGVPRPPHWSSLEHHSNLPNSHVHTCVHVNMYKYADWVADP